MKQHCPAIHAASLVLATMAVTAAIVLGGGRAIATNGATQCCISRAQIIDLAGSTARFDSATGAIHLFLGDPERASGRIQWRRHVDGVGYRGTGMLDLQQPLRHETDQELFLVDVRRGDTWVLRYRGGQLTWMPVPLR